MDDDSLRRGQPTLHIVHGEGMAILAGDGLLTEAFALMAREPASSDLAPRKLRAIETVSQAAGPEGMVGGQALDLHAVGTAHSIDGDALQAIHARKTGAMIRASVMAGAIMAGGDEQTVTTIAQFGKAGSPSRLSMTSWMGGRSSICAPQGRPGRQADVPLALRRRGLATPRRRAGRASARRFGGGAARRRPAR